MDVTSAKQSFNSRERVLTRLKMLVPIGFFIGRRVIVRLYDVPFLFKHRKSLYSKDLRVNLTILASRDEESFLTKPTSHVASKFYMFSTSYKTSKLREMLKQTMFLTCKVLACWLFACSVIGRRGRRHPLYKRDFGEMSQNEAR